MSLDYRSTLQFILADWQRNPVRLVLEVAAWFLAAAMAVIFAVTVPTVPFGITYPLVLTAQSIWLYSAISRGSFGLTMANLTMMCLDLWGYARYLMKT